MRKKNVAGYNLFSLESLSQSWLFRNLNTTEVGARGEGGQGEWGERRVVGCVCSLTKYSVHMKRLNQTESPIFVSLCVLCFQRQFLTFIFYLFGEYANSTE